MYRNGTYIVRSTVQCTEVVHLYVQKWSYRSGPHHVPKWSCTELVLPPIGCRSTHEFCTNSVYWSDDVQSHVSNSPSYIRDIVTTCRSATKRYGLRSSLTTDYVTPRLSTKFGERAFSFAGPHVWNQLPHQLHAISNPASFKKHLKTHFKFCFWLILA